MCGIAGALDLEGRRAFDPAALRRMGAALRHRGPDDEGAHEEPGLAMIAERLAIRDAPRGRQPVSDPSGRVWASQNGELFGAEALRGSLERAGHVFRTRCDTELWPALYLEEGPRPRELLARVSGQWAVALWDARERTLLLSRDRLGVCPLHVARADGWLLWASEIKALLASGLVRAEADLRGLDHVFSLFASGTRRTCFRGVESLWPGHALVARGGEARVERYWDLAFPPAGEGRRGPIEALTAEAQGLLAGAVEARLASDAPVAAYLSSGLDSALALSLAPPPRPQAFTVFHAEGGVDERRGAARVAGALGVGLERVGLRPADLLGALPAVVRAAEAPIMDTADASLLLLARRVHERGFKVVLTGEGADEAMGGYVWHKLGVALGALGRVAPALPAALRRAASAASAPGAAPPAFASRFGPERPGLAEVWDLLSRGRWLFYSDDLAARARAFDPFEDLDVDEGRMRAWAPLHRDLYLGYKVMLPGHLLHGKGDRISMATAVEARYPFLDDAFVAFASALAPEVKLRGLREKWLLRRVAARALPAAVPPPEKRMFKADPLCALEPKPAWVRELLSPASLRRTGYFSPERVAREERLQRALPPWSPRRAVADGSFTAVVTTQLWHHTFLGGGLCSLPAG